MALDLVLSILLVLANGFFVGTEFAVARVRATQAQEWVRNSRPGAKSVMHAVEHIDAYLSACQLGITLSSLGLGALGKPAFEKLLEPALGDAASVAGFGLATAIAFATITTLHVVVGELAPKSAAISRTEPVVLLLAPFMRAFYLTTKPIVDVFNFMGNLLLKPFGIPPASEAGSQPHSEGELRELLREASEQGTIDEGEGQMSDRALVFGDVRAREAMQPRAEIDYLHVDDTPETAARRAVETGRTRLPVCEPDRGLDETSGVVNAKDLLPLALDGNTHVPLSELLRPIGHFSESSRIDEVLREMRQKRVHLALVHDEHGTVIGLLTMEDVIEELVGEIDDEFDVARENLVTESEGRVVAEGGAPVRVLAERLGIDLGHHHESTVGGFISEHLGRLPEVGEHVDVGPLEHRIEVLAVDETRIAGIAVLDRIEPDENGDTGSFRVVSPE